MRPFRRVVLSAASFFCLAFAGNLRADIISADACAVGKPSESDESIRDRAYANLTKDAAERAGTVVIGKFQDRIREYGTRLRENVISRCDEYTCALLQKVEAKEEWTPAERKCCMHGVFKEDPAVLQDRVASYLDRVDCSQGSIFGLSDGVGVDYQCSVGLSYFSFDPNLPRDLVNHETHPDDRAFMTGDAGSTDLSKVDVTTADLRAGLLWYVMDYRFCLHADYVLKIPLAYEGREWRQNVNDTRPPSQGSFIFTEVCDVDPAHEVGLGASYFGKGSGGFMWEVKPMVNLGYWQASFQKGWDRFGRDQVAYVTHAKGYSLMPEVGVLVGSPAIRVGVNAGYRLVKFDYDTNDQGSDTARGWQVGAQCVFDL